MDATTEAGARNVDSPDAETSHPAFRELPFARPSTDTNAVRAIRQSWDIQGQESLRIGYVSGPGDVLGTYRHWQAGKHDPRVPVKTYPAQFYNLLSRLGAQGLVVAAWESSEAVPIEDERVRFEQVLQEPSSDRRSWIEAQRKRVAVTERVVAAFDPHVLIMASDHPWHSDPSILSLRPTFLSLHNTFWTRGRPWSRHGIASVITLRRASRRLADAICTSAECARQLRRVSGSAIQTEIEVPQAIFAVNPSPRGAARRFVFIGRVLPSKGVFHLLDAFASVSDRMPDATMTFVGDGAALDELRSRVTARGSDKIKVLGRRDGREIHEQLSQSDVLVCPTMSSFKEGLAITCLEAAQHGVPSIASSAVPAVDLLGHGAFEYPVHDTRALAETLLRVYGDPRAYAAAAAAAAQTATLMRDEERSWEICLLRLLTKAAPVTATSA